MFLRSTVATSESDRTFRHLVRDEDRIVILDEAVKELDGDLPADRKGLLQVIDRLFSASYTGQGESSSLASTPAWLPPLYRRYCDALIEANVLDFGSLLYFATRLLKEKPAVARVVRLGWSYVCVDEFQDTNRAQYDLLRLIAPARSHHLFVVADDDQIIYQWNGASPKRLRDLRQDYDLQTIQLPESYRCPPAIVSLANRLIGHNTRRIADEAHPGSSRPSADLRRRGRVQSVPVPTRRGGIRRTEYSRPRPAFVRLRCSRTHDAARPKCGRSTAVRWT